uniref:Uncharacterized protein n=1 Tax=Globisporangium ultimum (strain ATCC 200006 / CBS 805.95 / DAOM BR144) TaxID=431595 RepID=K3X4K4_GLOUD
MVTLLVLNCCATPISHCLLGSNEGHIRLAGVFVNMLLDMAPYIGLPSALLLPYANQINTELTNFDRPYWYTDI